MVGIHAATAKKSVVMSNLQGVGRVFIVYHPFQNLGIVLPQVYLDLP
jgi:hypothetical protein